MEFDLRREIEELARTCSEQQQLIHHVNICYNPYLQWGLECQIHSDFEWSKVFWMLNDSDCEWHSKTKQPDHSKSNQIADIFDSHVLVPFSTGPNYSFTEQSQIRTSKCSDFESSVIKPLLYIGLLFTKQSFILKFSGKIMIEFIIESHLWLPWNWWLTQIDFCFLFQTMDLSAFMTIIDFI